MRSLRTLWTGFLITADFKLNFSPTKAGGISELHQRTADRIKALVEDNQGLYIKLGQQLGTQAAVLPGPYRNAFSSFSDSAPSVPFEDILPVFAASFDGAHPDDVFDAFERTPMASASIAQVHRARLKDGKGTPVAVKVQKPQIPIQVEWDLASYRLMMWLMQTVFDYPTYFVASYVSEQMRRETDFLIETENARKTIEKLKATPSLRNDVYVPVVYPELSTNRIITMELVQGCRINDVEAIAKYKFKGGFRGVMDTVLDLFAVQIFEWRWVHCDPHPGNILVRPNPSNRRKSQIVLLDHGLYIPLSEKFRRQYSTLWRSIFVLDLPAIGSIAREWGIDFDTDLFASAILLRPTRLGPGRSKARSEEILKREQMSEYELQLDIKRRMRLMLENEEKIPRELIFLVRAQRMLQVENQILGSPSNRVHITAKWAARGYALSQPTRNRSIFAVGLRPWLREQRDVLTFQLALGLIDLGFYTVKLTSWVKALFGVKDEGLEEVLQRQFNSLAKEELGVDLEEAQTFEG